VACISRLVPTLGLDPSCCYSQLPAHSCLCEADGRICPKKRPSTRLRVGSYLPHLMT